jgi:hypothetical protein
VTSARMRAREARLKAFLKSTLNTTKSCSGYFFFNFYFILKGSVHLIKGASTSSADMKVMDFDITNKTRKISQNLQRSMFF